MRHRAGRKCVVFAIVLSVCGFVMAEQLDPRIASEIQAIHEQEKSGADVVKLGRLWAQLAWDYERGMDYTRSESAYNRALQYLERSSEKVDYAVVLSNLGSLYMLRGNYGDAERCRKRSLAIREAMGDQNEIARGKALLAEVYVVWHKYKEAHREAQEAYTSLVALKDSKRGDVFSTLITLIYAECFDGDCASALGHAREAISLTQMGFAADSVEVGHAHLALGFAEWKSGIKDGPDEEMRAAIEIMKGLPPPQGPYVLSALEQYRSYLDATNRKHEAKEIALEEAQFRNVQHECVNCTVSAYGLR